MEKQLDLVMVPLGLAFTAAYHCWLLFMILRYPHRTVVGTNALARRRWVKAMTADPMKNGVLAVQTIRNNIMASTVLATTAITITSLINVFVGIRTSSSSSSSSFTISPPLLLYGTEQSLAVISSSVKFFTISLCFILAFLCNVQSIRYYAHVSFLLTTPKTDHSLGGASWASHVARILNWGSFFWTLGLRAFYVSFTLFCWIFGPITMFASSVVMCVLLYFLDITAESGIGRDDHDVEQGNAYNCTNNN